ncbi:c-type cytochrome [Undibacterium arcticum]|uniref:C-type cytochrome n=1 Tax=Undibacterium arcticum TaxID=1762892 RepID=A0ABV7EVE1_9BURK
MSMAVALVVIVVGALLFHFVSPWWATPLASNWRAMDDTLTITLVITGIFFVGIHLFIIYTLLRFHRRHTPLAGHRAAGAAETFAPHAAAYIPEHRTLERWLTGGTAVAIMALLAPGLFVYADYIRAPRDALVLEVVGQQWQWRYRFPGNNGKLGLSNVRFVSAANPFGLDPDDPAGHDDILINGNEVHLPIDKPVKLLLRSHDTLHDFFVPPFRARINIVPGMVTSFWFTPTKPGRYEALCAQLCGIGHANMRGYVVVESEAAFRRWLAAQPTFAMTRMQAAGANVVLLDPQAARGKTLAQSKGCIACHTVDGSASVGPTWKGLFGKTETMADGSTALVDDAYLKDFIRNPQSRVVKGFAPMMPLIALSDDELAALIAYIRAVGTNATTAPAAAQSVPSQSAPSQPARVTVAPPKEEVHVR